MRSQYRIHRGKLLTYPTSGLKNFRDADSGPQLVTNETGNVVLEGIDLTLRPEPPLPEKCERGMSLPGRCNLVHQGTC